MDLRQFLKTLSIADQKAHRPKVESRDFDHPRFYWIFKNMDYDRWLARDPEVLLLTGPTNCTLDRVSSHIIGLMEEGLFGKDQIVLKFFSPDDATRGNGPIRSPRDSESTITIFVHTLLYQLISATVPGKRVSTATDFLCHLLNSIGHLELLARFKAISTGDPLDVIRKVLVIPDRTLCEALGKILERRNDLGIVVNMLGNMSGRGRDFFTAVSTLIRGLSERNSGLKALLTSGPLDDTRMALGGLSFIAIQYDKERKGLIAQFLILGQAM
jgi:hypothetical protein